MENRMKRLVSPLLLLCCCWLLAAQAAPQVLFVIGDTGDCRVEGAARVGAALRAQPDTGRGILVEVGDLAYPTATRERLLACHEPHFGGFAKRLAVPGNHDWRDPGAAGFFSLFSGAVPRKSKLDGPWALLLVDSNLRGEAWVEQLRWLDDTLAASRDECLIAVWHHPRWSSGQHGDNTFIAPLWQRVVGRAALTLHGHDHHFEALPPLDIKGDPDAGGSPSFVVGHGGAPLYTAGWKVRSERAHFGHWGFLRLELEGREYRWSAIGVDGKVVDSGRGACCPAP